MPNHVHGITWLAGPPVGARRPPISEGQFVQKFQQKPKSQTEQVDVSPLHHAETARPNGFPAGSLAARIAAFKIASRQAVNRLRGTPVALLWQRNYYERIIRNERELMATQQYILDNPMKWPEDPNYVG